MIRVAKTGRTTTHIIDCSINQPDHSEDHGALQEDEREERDL